MVEKKSLSVPSMITDQGKPNCDIQVYCSDRPLILKHKKYGIISLKRDNGMKFFGGMLFE